MWAVGTRDVVFRTTKSGVSEVTWGNLALNTLSLQIGLMLGPVLIMAVMLTKSLPSAFSNS